MKILRGADQHLGHWILHLVEPEDSGILRFEETGEMPERMDFAVLWNGFWRTGWIGSPTWFLSLSARFGRYRVLIVTTLAKRGHHEKERLSVSAQSDITEEEKATERRNVPENGKVRAREGKKLLLLSRPEFDS